MKGKKGFLPAAAAVALVLISIVLLNYSISLDREMKSLMLKQQELNQIRDEYLVLSMAVNAVEAKRSLSKVQGIVQAVDEVFQSIGLKQKVKSIKPLSTRDLKDSVEEDAEIILEKVDMNELVNVFHKIENAPMILAVKGAVLKTTFDTTERLNVTFTLSLIKPK
jgi:hypothetical protein